MSDLTVPLLTVADLLDLAPLHTTAPPCPVCAALVCAGWESVPGSFDRSRLREIGSLRHPGDEEPTFQEHHPDGTNGWSADAPIAPAFFPYNRCTVWQCTSCTRVFLRYTEYGGYYQEERIREFAPALLSGAAP